MKLNDLTKKNDDKRIEMFDYGSISDEQKKALNECANFLSTKHPDIAQTIRNKFYLVEPKKVKLETSNFLQLCKAANINYSLQGFTLTRDEKEEEIQYPIVSITEDIRELERLLLFIVKKYGLEIK